MLCTETFCSCEKLFLFHLNEFLGRKIPLFLLNVFEWVRIDRIKYRQIPGCRSFSTTCICISVHHWQQKQCWWGSKIYNIFAAIAVAAAEWCQKAKNYQEKRNINQLLSLSLLSSTKYYSTLHLIAFDFIVKTKNSRSNCTHFIGTYNRVKYVCQTK